MRCSLSSKQSKSKQHPLMLLLMIDVDASRAITANSRALGSLIDMFVDSIDALYDHCMSNIIDVAAVRQDQAQHAI